MASQQGSQLDPFVVLERGFCLYKLNILFIDAITPKF